MDDNSNVIEVTEYHKFVGLFVTQYAMLEFTLRFLIRKLSGLNGDQFDILVGFPRSGDLRTLAKKLADLAPLDDEARKDVNESFDQLVHLTTLRDRVVHFGANPIAKGGVILYSKDGQFFPERDQVEQNNLWNAAIDLNRVQHILLFRLFGPLPNLHELISQQGSWLYKPPPQVQNIQRRENHKAQRHQPKA